MEVISLASWTRSLVVPWVVWGVITGGLALAGVQPSAGGWPPVLIVTGAALVLWTVLAGLALPNRLEVTPEQIRRRVRRSWTVVPAGDVVSVEVTPLATGGTRVKVRSEEASILIGIGGGRRSGQVLGALRPYLDAAHAELGPPRSRVGQALVAAASAVVALVVVLRLALGA